MFFPPNFFPPFWSDAWQQRSVISSDKRTHGNAASKFSRPFLSCSNDVIYVICIFPVVRSTCSFSYYGTVVGHMQNFWQMLRNFNYIVDNRDKNKYSVKISGGVIWKADWNRYLVHLVFCFFWSIAFRQKSGGKIGIRVCT